MVVEKVKGVGVLADDNGGFPGLLSLFLIFFCWLEPQEFQSRRSFDRGSRRLGAAKQENGEYHDANNN